MSFKKKSAFILIIFLGLTGFVLYFSKQFKNTQYTRKWVLDTPKLILTEFIENKNGSDYPVIYAQNNQYRKKLASTQIITFESGEKSVGSFNRILVSPDRQFLFIEELGYEGSKYYGFETSSLKPLNQESSLNISGPTYWSPNARCVIETINEYGDQHVLRLGKKTNQGYYLYNYDQSIITNSPIENVVVKWQSENPCQSYITLTSNFLTNPPVATDYNNNPDFISPKQTFQFKFSLENGPIIITNLPESITLLPSVKGYGLKPE